MPSGGQEAVLPSLEGSHLGPRIGLVLIEGCVHAQQLLDAMKIAKAPWSSLAKMPGVFFLWSSIRRMPTW